MPEVSLSTWNEFMRQRSEAHLLQTGEWGQLKSTFGWSAIRLIHGDSGAQILFRKLPLGLSVGYIPKPALHEPFAQLSQELISEIDTNCRKNRAVFCKLEPDELELNAPGPIPPGWRRSATNIQPPRTIVVSLFGTEAEILARMKPKTRYNIGLAGKKGVTVRTWADIPTFHTMLLQTGERDRFEVHSLDYYQRAYDLFHPAAGCELLVADFEGRPLAAVMVFARGARAWYMYGASTDEQRNRMPTYLLQWEAMRWAKARGCVEYDLWGVPDERQADLEAGFETRSNGLWGVYRFKRGFGGELRRAAQACDRVYNPLLYKFYLWRTAGSEALA